MDLKVTRYEIDAGVATVWFHRPGRGNSWTNRMNAEYRWIMDRLDRDPAVRVVVVTGSGDRFCVGADAKALDHYAGSDEDYRENVAASSTVRPGAGGPPEFDHDLVWHWNLRVPVIAAVNGACAGIAAAIVSFCDLRYAVEGTKFTTSTPRLGLPAEYGLSWVLPRIVGTTHAADILFTGRVVLTDELLAMGYLNGLYPREGFLDRVYETARMIADQVSPASVATAKRQLYGDLVQHDAGGSVEHSKELIGTMMRGPDFAEGVAALAERRPPRFPAPVIDQPVAAGP